MKVAPVLLELNKYPDVLAEVVHTGQHYDYEMSDIFLKDLGIKKPDYFFEAGTGTHAEQTARIMLAFEKICIKSKPNLVIVVGDVNSTLACALTAKKLNIKIAHIESGLRSFDMSMPEEINRMVVDRISDFLFVSEKSGIVNLKREGADCKNIFFVGNTMIDSLLFGLNRLKEVDSRRFRTSQLKQSLGDYGVVTLHRPSNVDEKGTLAGIVAVLSHIARKTPLIIPLHPRTRKNLRRFRIKIPNHIYSLAPLGYLEFLFLYKDARFVLTDSGGLQEETTFLKIPCLTLRQNTERPVTVTQGTNTIVGNNIRSVVAKVDSILA
ncbi:MAG: UDP-N-acetylglucosamine 2-epimerase (non-hydrolyzing), partial [Candidatus Omnitrophica bacterium]|nr:UDP-N-acetylglucosamine 2-epimerase (non-hydrolyzing) [Candidatus Omnitrophota bacterium]